MKSDGLTILTGSYRDKNVLEIWDLRQNEKVRDIDWNGVPEQHVKADGKVSRAAPFIYSCIINNNTNVVLAGGAGANEVRMFDFNSGRLLGAI